MLGRIIISCIVSLMLMSVAYTQDELPDTRHFGDGFVVNQTLSGLPLHWENGVMEYHISESVPNRFQDPVQAGFDAWNLRPEISDLIHSEFIDLTPSTQWGGPVDGINNVVYIDRNWTETTGAGEETVALTRIRYNAFTGRITDADIALNADHHRFSHNAHHSRHDVHNIISHEVGHVWGLSDLFPPGHPGHHGDMGDDDENQLETMYGVFPLGETTKQVIHHGDIDGIKYIYEELPVLNVDIVLAFDGSDNYMNAFEPSKNSSLGLVDKMDDGDGLGVVRFTKVNGEEDIEDLTVTKLNTKRNELKELIGGLSGVEGGRVALGSGLLAAQDLFDPGSQNFRAIILFSRGEEQEPPWAIDELENLTVPVYTIGFEGSSGNTILSTISDATGGEFLSVPDETYISDAVNQIWTHISSQMIIFAGSTMISDVNWDWEEEYFVDSDLERERIETGGLWFGSSVDLCLIDPDRIEICFNPVTDEVECYDPQENKIDCPAGVQFFPGNTYGFYCIDNPKGGSWKSIIKNVSDAGPQPFFGFVRGKPNEFIMSAELDKKWYIINEDDISISVSLIRGGRQRQPWEHGSFGEGVTGATVEAEVILPDGTLRENNIVFSDLGDGNYVATFNKNDIELPGNYKFTVKASKEGEFTRQSVLSAYVATSEDEFAIMTSISIVNHMINYIAGLPVTAFRPASEGRRGSLINKLEVVLGHIEAEAYDKAIDKLANDLLPKFGYEPSSEDNIWIDDEEAQDHLISQALRVIDILTEIIADPDMAKWMDQDSIAQGDIPDRFDISQNYPNPFNPVTTIRYQLPDDLHVTLSVYNMLGQRVRMLVDDIQTAGYYTIQWDGTNQSGMPLSSGMYFYRIQAGRYSEVHKMLFMK